MKSIIYSVVAIFTLVCFALAQQAPDSAAYDSSPWSLHLRAQMNGPLTPIPGRQGTFAAASSSRASDLSLIIVPGVGL